ncbi:hypothetical protein F4779DRAFT_519835 [Xylariaceae sp. FL0662B]|nr:hypothetical protein F4779DRAFT_519835 [Xylariaceae sp. FL0662B]
MASYGTQYYTSAVPIPGKESQYPCSPYGGYYAHSNSDSQYSASPPEEGEASDSAERAASATSAGAHHHHHHHHHDSHHHDANSSSNGASYATSTTGDYGYGGSASALDFNDYMQGRFDDTFDPIPLDRSLATQAQTSGKLNNKHRELLEMQAQAQARLAKTRARFQRGMQDARDVNADLEWTSKKVSSLKKKAEKKHAREYQKARERYPSPDY